jgi:hypothetical protein
MRGWKELVHKAQQGDLDAFDALVERFRDMAVGYAYSFLRDFPLAEEPGDGSAGRGRAGGRKGWWR